MMPKVIAQTEVSLDGAIGGFQVHMSVYYGIASELGADAELFGSETMLKADMPDAPEGPDKLHKPAPKPGDDRHLWFVPDSRGRVRKLHLYRDTEWCLDLVMLIAETTPADYRRYLEERDYDYIVAGHDRVDLRAALEEISRRYGIKALRADSGGVLISALLQQRLVDELSLLVDPVLVGTAHARMFRTLDLPQSIKLRLLNADVLRDGLVHLHYAVER